MESEQPFLVFFKMRLGIVFQDKIRRLSLDGIGKHGSANNVRFSAKKTTSTFDVGGRLVVSTVSHTQLNPVRGGKHTFCENSPN